MKLWDMPYHKGNVDHTQGWSHIVTFELSREDLGASARLQMQLQLQAAQPSCTAEG